VESGDGGDLAAATDGFGGVGLEDLDAADAPEVDAADMPEVDAGDVPEVDARDAPEVDAGDVPVPAVGVVGFDAVFVEVAGWAPVDPGAALAAVGSAVPAAGSGLGCGGAGRGCILALPLAVSLRVSVPGAAGWSGRNHTSMASRSRSIPASGVART
jgi:hypothetical protein